MVPEEPDGGDGGEDDEPARLGLQRPYNHLRSSAVYRVRVASGHPTPRHKIWQDITAASHRMAGLHSKPGRVVLVNLLTVTAVKT